MSRHHLYNLYKINNFYINILMNTSLLILAISFQTNYLSYYNFDSEIRIKVLRKGNYDVINSNFLNYTIIGILKLLIIQK